jgi:HK97 family phage major capsid protein
LTKASLVEGTDSTGGVLVPEQWADEVYEAAMENAIVRPRANVLPMSTDTLPIPVLVDGSRATNIFGGITLTAVGEGGDQYATTGAPVFGLLKLTAHKFIASTFVSNELAADARAFGPFMVQAFGKAVRFLEDDLFINGTGSGQPLGIMHAPALLAIVRNAGFGAIASDDFANMAARLAPGCWANAVWLINQSVLSTLANDATSGANAFGMIDMSSLTALGRPIVVTEHCAATAAVGDIILADFSQYVIGDREMRIESSREATYSSNSYGWLQDQSLWKLTLRVAGQPLVSAPYTPKHGGSTVSPFVTLTTAS